MKSFLAIFLVTISTYGFTQTVSGFVVDKNNNPVIGARVMEAQSMNGTTTNIDGSFILDLNSPDAPVIVSFVGYEADTIKLSTQVLSQVVLKERQNTSSSIYKSLSDYRVILIIVWTIICAWLVIRTFRGVASA